MGLGTFVPCGTVPSMEKMAENCGGRSGARSPDLLGVNDRNTRQLRHLAKAVRGRFANKDPLSSVSVSRLGTKRTKPIDVEDMGDAAAALDWVGPLLQAKPEPEPRTLKRGHIYFIAAETGPVKIGFTSNLRKRLSRLQMGSPVKLSVIATKEGDTADERHYHLRYMHYRLHGEWFERCPEIEAEIERLTA